MAKKANSKEELLREFAVANDCDAVMLTDGTIKKYRGERCNAVALYKIRTRKYYDWFGSEEKKK